MTRSSMVPVVLLVWFGCGQVADKPMPDAGVDAPPAPTCIDGLKNGTETDVDCGGPSCGACADARSCAARTDCLSGVCTNQVCAAPTCSDGVANADELAADCGGHCGDGSCDFGQTCNATDALCASGLCSANGCAIRYGFTGSVETFTVPAGVSSIKIEAAGAGGADNPGNLGGKGATLTGTFTVAAGDVLTIGVGGTGVLGDNNGGFTGGGGGGGSGVVRGTTALLIAGGGGGAGHQNGGQDAVLVADGTTGFSTGSGQGGLGGTGGADGADNSMASAAGGRGWNLGVPTEGVAKTHAGGWGFGGGGGGSGTDGHAGGGGGGYSGGGGGWDGGGGGGGSFNAGTDPVTMAGVQTGHGYVLIQP